MTGTANELTLAAQLAPPEIIDDAGVSLAVHHLEFVSLGAQDLADWRARRSPLGMKPGQYREFCAEFFQAANQDGYQDSEFDVRLKGSSAVVYSGRHKQLPPSVHLAFSEFARVNKRPPSSSEEDIIRERLDIMRSWQSWPRRRPFDSMFVLTIDSKPSDFDLQISSERIVRDCDSYRSQMAQQGIAQRPLIHPTYGFVQDEFFNSVCQWIARWASIWTTRLGRDVNVKSFVGAGPENKTTAIGELSSHFRAQDWMIKRPIPGQD